MGSKFSKKVFSILLSVLVVMNMIPTSAVAEAVAEQRETVEPGMASEMAPEPTANVQDDVMLFAYDESFLTTKHAVG